jgi:hypothetical protein
VDASRAVEWQLAEDGGSSVSERGHEMTTRGIVRFLPVVACVLASAHGSVADQVVSRGDVYYLFLQSGTGPQFQTTIGYGSPTNTIGDDIWFDGVGVYNASGGLGFPGFLTWATNGISDAFLVSLSDSAGHTASGVFHSSYDELGWYGHYPDLAPLEVAGARLVVESLSLSTRGAFLDIHWEFLGTPEPASAYLFALGTACLLARTRRGIRKAKGCDH